MKKLASGVVAALLSVTGAYAMATEIRHSEEVRIDPQVKHDAHVAKQKTKRAAKTASAKTKSAAKRTSAAAHRGAKKTEAAAEHAADRTRAAADRTAVRVDTKVDDNRGEAVVERNR